MISRAGHVTAGRRTRGFTLIELLIGASIAAVILSAAYTWLWNMGVRGRRRRRSAGRDACGRGDPRGRRRHLRRRRRDRAAFGARSLAVARASARPRRRRARGGPYRLGSGTRRRVEERIRHVPRGPCLRVHIAYALADGSLVDGGDMTSSCWSAVRAVHVASRPPSARRPLGDPSRLRWALHDAAAVVGRLRDAGRSAGHGPRGHVHARRSRRGAQGAGGWRALTRPVGGLMRRRGKRYRRRRALFAGDRRQRPGLNQEVTPPLASRGRSRGPPLCQWREWLGLASPHRSRRLPGVAAAG